MNELSAQEIQEVPKFSLPYYRSFCDYRFIAHYVVLEFYQSRRGNKWYAVADICRLFRFDIDEKIYLYGYLKNHKKTKRIGITDDNSQLHTQAKFLVDIPLIQNRAKRYRISLKNNEINPIINEL